MCFLPTAYVVRREGNVLTRVCPSIHPSICLSIPRGVPWPGPAGARGGDPSQVQLGGYPARGYPPWVHPLLDLARGTPMGMYPSWVSPIIPGWGVPQQGYPDGGTPTGDPTSGPHIGPHQGEVP